MRHAFLSNMRSREIVIAMQHQSHIGLRPSRGSGLLSPTSTLRPGAAIGRWASTLHL
ncbi:hypothetical protein PROAA_930028 [Candidatus Propionivibrio aalborgensis]|uniref:Uncharacterized protein n=1 Tax=Candidatus Propionivibrio aalborgensis TaxID=1860101 RepID=A0A1A8Y2K8_9RHOO|nr:hypothetical protein PROAA_930028 [Candidatus Propionivibrio aalborgensis]